MNVERVTLDRAEAARLFRKYKEHRAYSAPVDWEIQRTYQLLAAGKVVIRALESITRAGLDGTGLPKLAIARATAKQCHLRRYRDGSFHMAADAWGRVRSTTHEWPRNSFQFPVETFPFDWHGKSRVGSSGHQAQVPIIPIYLRPKRGLENYHVLWEAEWQPIPPRDPFLLRRIGKADLWLVVAQWDLTDVERAALATRVLP